MSVRYTKEMIQLKNEMHGALVIIRDSFDALLEKLARQEEEQQQEDHERYTGPHGALLQPRRTKGASK